MHQIKPLFFILVILLLAKAPCLQAQKTEYRLDKLFLIFNEDEFVKTHHYASLMGHDSVVTYSCDGRLVIDEQGKTITGSVSFLCDMCAQLNTKDSFNFAMENHGDGVYAVQKVLYGTSVTQNIRNEYSFTVDSAHGRIRVSFNYIGVFEQLFYFQFIGGKAHVKKQKKSTDTEANNDAKAKEQSQSYKNINEAIEAQDTQAVKKFIADGADLNALYDCKGLTESPLNFTADFYPRNSILKNHIIAEMLLQKGANVNAQNNNNGNTALMVAVNGNNYDIFKLLLSYGANKKLKSKSGETALAIAKANVKLSSFNAVAPIMLDELKK